MNSTARLRFFSLILAGVALLGAGCDRKSTTDGPLADNRNNSPEATAPADTASGLIMPPTASGNRQMNTTGSTDTPLSTVEQTFARTVAESGLYEVTVAKLAADKAKHADVKAMATALIDDHTKANTQLAMAVGARASLPTSIPLDKQKIIDQLNKLSGADFDREFIKIAGIQDHQADIAMFESAQNSLKDPALRDFVQNTLPTLRHHLTMAQDVARKVESGS